MKEISKSKPSGEFRQRRRQWSRLLVLSYYIRIPVNKKRLDDEVGATRTEQRP